jgi:cytoskeletal protein RodZ
MIKHVGKQLQQARIDQDKTLEQISEELHIRTRYLKALEDGDLSILPSAVQVRGFLRLYADYLKLDANELLNSLQQAPPEDQSEEVIPPDVDLPAGDNKKIDEVVSAIFEEISFAIKQRRELLGLSIEDIEEHTHIPAHYIGYLESGQFDSFPSPVQARGMLGNYVNFLEMDASAILLRYAEALQAGLAVRQRTSSGPAEKSRTAQGSQRVPVRQRMPLWLRSLVSPDTFFIGGVGIAVILVTIWGIGRITQSISQAVPQPTAPSLAEVLVPSDTPLPSPTGTLLVTPTLELVDIGDEEAAEETGIPTVPISGQANVQLYIITRQRTYLRVTVDGVVEFDGRVNAGINLTFTGSQSVEVLTGNAAALQIFFNQQDMGSLGILGEVIDLVFTRDGVVIPTVTPTPTLSPEELLDLTPTAESEPDVPEPVDTPIP